MSKYVKQLMRDELRHTLSGVKDVVIVSVNGIDGIKNNEMRLALRRKNIQLRVVKNRLARLTLQDVGLGAATQFLDGPAAVVWGGQIVDLAKEITVWGGKVDKLQIRGGATGTTPLTAEHVKALSTLPSREELLGRVVNLMLSPARRAVTLATSPASRLVGQIKAKAEAAGDTANEPAAAPA
jgi:large subunit ribosomal protein L10